MATTKKDAWDMFKYALDAFDRAVEVGSSAELRERYIQQAANWASIYNAMANKPRKDTP